MIKELESFIPKLVLYSLKDKWFRFIRANGFITLKSFIRMKVNSKVIKIIGIGKLRMYHKSSSPFLIKSYPLNNKD